MLTQATIDQSIASSVETIRARLMQVPITREQIARVYGLDMSTVLQILAGIDMPQPVHEQRLYRIVCSYSLCTSAYAVWQVAELLSGLRIVHTRLYTSYGVLGPMMIVPHPDGIGLPNGVTDNDTLIFRQPYPIDSDPTIGQPIMTQLYRCRRLDLAKFTGTDYPRWHSLHATVHQCPPRGEDQMLPSVYDTLHLSFGIRCSGARIHELALNDNVTSIIDRKHAFR